MSDIDIRFTGKLGKDPELKGEGEAAFCVFSVAVDQYAGKDKGDLRDGKPTDRKTTWLNVKIFKGMGKFVHDRFSKGDTIVVTGEFEARTYEKKDREGHVIDPSAVAFSVIARDVKGPFRTVSKAGNGDAATAGPVPTPAPVRTAAPAPRQATAPTAGPAFNDDEIPF